MAGHDTDGNTPPASDRDAVADVRTLLDMYQPAAHREDALSQELRDLDERRRELINAQHLAVVAGEGLAAALHGALRGVDANTLAGVSADLYRDLYSHENGPDSEDFRRHLYEASLKW